MKMPGDQGATLEEEHDDGSSAGFSASVLSRRPDTTSCNDFFLKTVLNCMLPVCMYVCARMCECIHGGM